MPILYPFIDYVTDLHCIVKSFWETHHTSMGFNYHMSKIRKHGLVCPLFFCSNIWKLAFVFNILSIPIWKNPRRPKLSF